MSLTTFRLAFLTAASGVIAALAFMLWPLPTVDAFGGPVAWCGPGTTSASALRVATRPDVVNEGGGDATPEQRDMLEQVCVGEAQTRMTQAAISAAAGLLLGGALYTMGRKGI